MGKLRGNIIEKRDVKIQVKDIEEGVKVIKIEGELDTLTSPQADKIISPLIAEGKSIIIDCNNLSYLNSTGLALLLKFYIQLRKRNSSLKIVNPSKFVYEAMDIFGVLKQLKIYKTQEEAIKSLNEGGR